MNIFCITSVCVCALIMVTGTAQALECYDCRVTAIDLSGSGLDQSSRDRIQEDLAADSEPKCKSGDLLDSSVETSSCTGQCVWLKITGNLNYPVGDTGNTVPAGIEAYFRTCLLDAMVPAEYSDRCGTNLNISQVTPYLEGLDAASYVYTDYHAEACFCSDDKCNDGDSAVAVGGTTVAYGNATVASGGATVAADAFIVLCLVVVFVWY